MPNFLATFEIIRNNMLPIVKPGGVEQVPIIAGGTLVYNPGLVLTNQIPGVGFTRSNDAFTIGLWELDKALNAGAAAVLAPTAAAAFQPAMVAAIASTPTMPAPDGDGLAPLYMGRSGGLGSILAVAIGTVVTSTGAAIIGPPPIVPSTVTIPPIVNPLWLVQQQFAGKNMIFDAAVIRFVSTIFIPGSPN